MNIVHALFKFNSIIAVLFTDLSELRIIGKYGLFKELTCFGKASRHIGYRIVDFTYDIVDIRYRS